MEAGVEGNGSEDDSLRDEMYSFCRSRFLGVKCL